MRIRDLGSGVGEKRLAYLDAMGVDVWVQREFGAAANERCEGVPKPPHPGPLPGGEGEIVASDDAVNNIAGLDWDLLRERVLACTRCDLHKQRTQAVFGVGNRKAEWLIIGEAPGADEDRQGEPFVGRAGKLLNNMLLAIGLQREEVYIANIVKCRPPNNREPAPEEAQACESYLARQIDLLKPKIILAVGRVAAQNLLKTDTRVGALRGKRLFYGESNIPVVVTYHPAYLLRSPQEKRKAWNDLCFAKEIFQAQ